jgi:hypothetical protein
MKVGPGSRSGWNAGAGDTHLSMASSKREDQVVGVSFR